MKEAVRSRQWITNASPGSGFARLGNRQPTEVPPCRHGLRAFWQVLPMACARSAASDAPVGPNPTPLQPGAVTSRIIHRDYLSWATLSSREEHEHDCTTLSHVSAWWR